MNEPRTVWQLVAIPGHGNLNVQLVVDTTAPAVVAAIERAANDAGVALKRVEAQAPAAEAS